MSLLRSFPKLSFTLVLLSIVGISVAQRSVGLLLVAGALAAISWYLTEGPRGRWLPRWVSNVLVVAVSLNVLAEIVRTPDDILGVLGRFILWLMIVKLYERRSSRDHGHLLGLSLLLMITGCLQSVDLFFGLVLAGYAALGLYVLVLYQLHAAQEQMRSERQASVPSGIRFAPTVRPITGRHVAGHFRSLIVGVAVVGFLLGMLVFVMFPRGVGEGAVSGLPSPRQDRRSGYSDEVDLFMGGRITDSRRAVMTVRLRDHLDQPIVASEPVLLRGAALDRYEGRGKWRIATRPTLDLRVVPNRFTPLSGRVPAAEPTSRIVTQEFQLVQEMDTIFSIHPAISMSAGLSHTLQYDPARVTLRHAKGTSSSERFQRYSVRAAPNPSDALLAALSTGSEVVPALSHSLRDEQVLALARQLLRDAGVPEVPPGGVNSPERFQWHHDVASVFTAFLQSGDFIYTTDLTGVVIPDEIGERSAGMVDPISYFLLDLRRGHCEYFASGLAYLCLHMEVPARLATGFVAYDYDESNQRYNVVEANAHAWVEVRTGANRWSTFDPTPPATLRDLHEGSDSVADRLRWFYDSFDGAWSRTIVDFDRTQQARMAEAGLPATVGERARRALQGVRAWMDRVNAAFYLGPAGYIYMAFIGCVLIFAIVVLIKLMRRSRAIKKTLRLGHLRGRQYQQFLRQLGFYLDMLDVLNRAGYQKPIWQPPLAFIRDLAERIGPQSTPAQLMNGILEVFYEARYGGRSLTNQDVAHANAMVRDLALSLNVRPKRTFINVK